MTLSVEQHVCVIERMIKTVEKDCRDEWPTNNQSYTKGETIQHGTFGIVRFAEAYVPLFGLHGLDTRNCVIKTVYLRRRFETILNAASPKNDESSGSLEVSGDETVNIENKKLRLMRIYRHTVMELFVLNRCRHANILHSHAVFLTDGDLNIVFPRLYHLGMLIDGYRDRKNSEPMPVTIIAKIIRQLCLGLDFLQRAAIVHRDVQPANIFFTRAGTVKLGHFGQSCSLLPKIGSVDADYSNDENYMACKTPVGKEEFMCAEKLHNLFNAKTVKECMDYSFSADMWSVGVLVLSMVSYFPNESHHKLDREFALIMNEERMPFIWLTVEMTQLRSRLVKSGGEDLKLWLSNHLLTFSPKHRATAASLLETPEMGRWCLPTVEEDSDFLRNKIINEVDFVNHLKLEDDGPNYNCLESKDIPAEYYWDDTWKELENMEFVVRFNYQLTSSREYTFRFSSPAPLFRLIWMEISQNRLEMTDLIPVDYEIKQMIFQLVNRKKKERTFEYSPITKRVILAADQSEGEEQILRSVKVELKFASNLAM